MLDIAPISESGRFSVNLVDKTCKFALPTRPDRDGHLLEDLMKAPSWRIWTACEGEETSFSPVFPLSHNTRYDLPHYQYTKSTT